MDIIIMERLSRLFSQHYHHISIDQLLYLAGGIYAQPMYC